MLYLQKAPLRLLLIPLIIGLSACTPSHPPSGNSPKERIQHIEITTTGADHYFYKDTIRVEAGIPVNIKLINPEKLPIMRHNLVIADPDSANRIAQRGLTLGPDFDFVPPHYQSVKAHTPVAGPRDTVALQTTFDHPDTLAYFCTYPGHFSDAHGVFIIHAQQPDSSNSKPN